MNTIMPFNQRLSENFTLAELIVTDQGVWNSPNAVEVAYLRALVIGVLQPLRNALRRPVKVKFAFRSEAVNRLVGGSPDNQHRLGQAADISVDGITSLALARTIVALQLPYDQVIEEFGLWVHVSHGPRNRRQQLTAVKRMGKTVYLQGLGG